MLYQQLIYIHLTIYYTPSHVIQGNLDVTLLKPHTKGGPVTPAELQTLRDEVYTMLHALGPQNLIANLAEGLSGAEDPVLVGAFIDSVHELSEELIKGQ